jgi:hypothetical protein
MMRDQMNVARGRWRERQLIGRSYVRKERRVCGLLQGFNRWLRKRDRRERHFRYLVSAASSSCDLTVSDQRFVLDKLHFPPSPKDVIVQTVGNIHCALGLDSIHPSVCSIESAVMRSDQGVVGDR